MRLRPQIKPLVCFALIAIIELGVVLLIVAKAGLGALVPLIPMLVILMPFLLLMANWEKKKTDRVKADIEAALKEFADAERDFYHRHNQFSSAPHLDLDLPAPNGRVHEVLEVSQDGKSALIRVREQEYIRQQIVEV
jgi:hypothetical protein